MIVIDASVVLAWYFPDERTRWLEQLLEQVLAEGAVVPVHWKAEVANAFAMGVRHARISSEYRQSSLEELSALGIEADQQSDVELWRATQILCDTYKLTAYDASYLELSLRRRLPLATLDRRLAAAASRAGAALSIPDL